MEKNRGNNTHKKKTPPSIGALAETRRRTETYIEIESSRIGAETETQAVTTFEANRTETQKFEILRALSRALSGL